MCQQAVSPLEVWLSTEGRAFRIRHFQALFRQQFWPNRQRESLLSKDTFQTYTTSLCDMS